MDEAYLQFGVPGLPYSAVRIPLVEDLEEQDAWVARAMNAAQLLANAYYEAFGGAEPSPEPVQRPRTAPPPGKPTTPLNGQAQRASQAAPRRAPAGTTVAGSGAYCPEHPNVEVIPSKPQYARYEEDEFGNQVQANFFCPGSENGTGKNHNLWRRQLVWPEPEAGQPF